MCRVYISKEDYKHGTLVIYKEAFKKTTESFYRGCYDVDNNI